MRHPSNNVEYFLMDIIDASSFTLIILNLVIL